MRVRFLFNSPSISTLSIQEWIPSPSLFQARTADLISSTSLLCCFFSTHHFSVSDPLTNSANSGHTNPNSGACRSIVDKLHFMSLLWWYCSIFFKTSIVYLSTVCSVHWYHSWWFHFLPALKILCFSVAFSLIPMESISDNMLSLTLDHSCIPWAILLRKAQGLI